MAPPKRISREDLLAKLAAAFADSAAPSMDEMAVAAGSGAQPGPGRRAEAS